jgi:glycosyltransferase involved in cell wall biosynthesis
MPKRALMGLIFFPRGGSAHVAKNLATALPAHGWEAKVVSGSVRIPGRPGDARAFYGGLDVHAVDMTDALAAPDPMLADPPMHPSYEDRPGAADRVFWSLDDEAYEHQVQAWARELRAAGAATVDVLHLHHLTPLHEAAARVAPDAPVVGHLHGTELLMLEELDAEHPWAERMRGWAQRCERLIVLSDNQVTRAEDLLGVEADRCVRVSNGFDPATFEPRHRDVAEDAEGSETSGSPDVAEDAERSETSGRRKQKLFWRRHLVEAPQGWAPGGEPGSVRYTDADLRHFAGDHPVLLYVGRFTAVKRIGLLIDAYARARAEFDRPAPLVLLGGFPGEWEGEHPLEAIERTGAEHVYLAGWHGHEALADFFAASDVVVLPSVREQFGQVLVEGMACGLPAIAVDAHGPAEIVRHGKTGWLVEPDDVAGLARALVEAVNRPDERRRRGRAAHDDVRGRFSWPALAGDVARIYEEVAALARSR